MYPYFGIAITNVVLFFMVLSLSNDFMNANDLEKNTKSFFILILVQFISITLFSHFCSDSDPMSAKVSTEI